jgi:cysteine-rich repeat protein
VLADEEECDDGNSSNNDTCTNGCLTNVCGDGFVAPNEGCDDGAENADDGECTTACAPKECGDGDVQPGEECDDGNTNNADGCSNTCVAGLCGDNIRQDPE